MEYNTSDNKQNIITKSIQRPRPKAANPIKPVKTSTTSCFVFDPDWSLRGLCAVSGDKLAVPGLGKLPVGETSGAFAGVAEVAGTLGLVAGGDVSGAVSGGGVVVGGGVTGATTGDGGGIAGGTTGEGEGLGGDCVGVLVGGATGGDVGVGVGVGVGEAFGVAVGGEGREELGAIDGVVDGVIVREWPGDITGDGDDDELDCGAAAGAICAPLSW
ncbi:hypothetical protein NE237_014558 [Protea cynaroides]|uniref:Uncharacterized protein n=1 Tax=Protea cynaroides TaxID=273540 RepID=A0A9Q0QQ73_9MAGN|nr:hypothetical protein NE237_014558 [Protea cynaroides]